MRQTIKIYLVKTNNLKFIVAYIKACPRKSFADFPRVAYKLVAYKNTYIV